MVVFSFKRRRLFELCNAVSAFLLRSNICRIHDKHRTTNHMRVEDAWNCRVCFDSSCFHVRLHISDLSQCCCSFCVWFALRLRDHIPHCPPNIDTPQKTFRFRVSIGKYVPDLDLSEKVEEKWWNMKNMKLIFQNQNFFTYNCCSQLYFACIFNINVSINLCWQHIQHSFSLYCVGL